MSRGHPRLSCRVSDTLQQALLALAAQRGVDVSTLVREALCTTLPATPHDLEACAQALLASYDATTQHQLQAAMRQLGVSSLQQLLPALVRQWAVLQQRVNALRRS